MPARKTRGSGQSSSSLPRLDMDTSGHYIVPTLHELLQINGGYIHTVEHNGEMKEYNFESIDCLSDPRKDATIGTRSDTSTEGMDDDDDDDGDLSEEDEKLKLDLITTDNYEDYLGELDFIYDLLPPVIWTMWSTLFLTNVKWCQGDVTPMMIRDRDWLPRFDIARYQYQVAHKILGITHPNLMAAAIDLGISIDWNHVRNRFYQDMHGTTNDGTIYTKMRGMLKNGVTKKKKTPSRYYEDDGDLILEDEDGGVVDVTGNNESESDDTSDDNNRRDDQTDEKESLDGNIVTRSSDRLNNKRQRTDASGSGGITPRREVTPPSSDNGLSHTIDALNRRTISCNADATREYSEVNELLTSIADASRSLQAITSGMVTTVTGNKADVEALVGLRQGLHERLTHAIGEMQRSYDVLYSSYIDLNRTVDSLAYWDYFNQGARSEEQVANAVRSIIESTHPHLSIVNPGLGRPLKIVPETLNEMAEGLQLYSRNDVHNRYTVRCARCFLHKTFTRTYTHTQTSCRCQPYG